MLEATEAGHEVACHFWREVPAVAPIAAGIDADPVLVRLQGFFRSRGRDDRAAALASPAPRT